MGTELTDRDLAVDAAEREIMEALMAARKKHSLTSNEYLQILAGAMQERLKFALRAERKES